MKWESHGKAHRATQGTRWVIAALAILGAIAAGCSKKTAPAIRAVIVIGEVSLNRTGTRLSAGDVLKPDDTVITGPCSLAEIRIPGSTDIRIYENSSFSPGSPAGHQPPFGNDSEIALLKGKLLILAQKRAPGSVLRVRTPTTVIAVRGTALFVQVKEKRGAPLTEVSLIEGTVSVAPVNTPSEATTLNSGDALGTDASNIVSTEKIAPEKMKAFRDELSTLKESGAGTAGAKAPLAPPPFPAGKNALPPRELASEKEIEEYFKRIETVYLDDGTKLVGAMTYHDEDTVTIYTEHGVLRVPRSGIVKIITR